MRITTDRLLREFAPDDWVDVLAYQRDPRYLRLYPLAVGIEKGVVYLHRSQES
ncbi:MAG: hypothetical protein V3U95_04515 [Dehalococcoidia bacterium]